MSFAMALAVAGQGVIIAQTRYGAGKHLGDIDEWRIPIGMKLNFISQPIFLFGICVVKLAVGASLLRIASTKFYKWTISIIMGFMLFYTIGCFFVSSRTGPLLYILLIKSFCRLLCSSAPISECSGTRPYRPCAGHRRLSRACRTPTRASIS